MNYSLVVRQVPNYSACTLSLRSALRLFCVVKILVMPEEDTFGGVCSKSSGGFGGRCVRWRLFKILTWQASSWGTLLPPPFLLREAKASSLIILLPLGTNVFVSVFCEAAVSNARLAILSS